MDINLVGLLSTIFMGIVLGMIGGGGSILTVPILVYFFNVSPLQSTAYSLIVVGFSALVGAWMSYKNQDVDVVKAIIFGIPGIIGVFFARSFLLPQIPNVISFMEFELTKNNLILGFFAILMLVASLSMIIGKTQETNQSKMVQVQPASKSWVLLLEGLIVGVITGFVGAGGGFLIIPALVKFAKLPMKIAVGSSLVIIALKSLLGVLGDASSLLELSPKLLITMIILSLVGMIMGIRLRSKVSPSILKKLFGYFVMIMGIFIITKEFF